MAQDGGPTGIAVVQKLGVDHPVGAIGSTVGWARDHLPESPLLDAYVERLAARPAHARAIARDGAPPLFAQAS